MRKVKEKRQGRRPEGRGRGQARVSRGQALGLWSFPVKRGMALINHPNFSILVVVVFFFLKLILFSALQTPDADV